MGKLPIWKNCTFSDYRRILYRTVEKFLISKIMPQWKYNMRASFHGIIATGVAWKQGTLLLPGHLVSLRIILYSGIWDRSDEDSHGFVLSLPTSTRNKGSALLPCTCTYHQSFDNKIEMNVYDNLISLFFFRIKFRSFRLQSEEFTAKGIKGKWTL